MTLVGLIIYIVVGAVAGYLAGLIMKGGGFGFVINAIIGIVGAFVGGWLFGLIGISFSGWIGWLIGAVVGACILLWVLSFFKKK